MLWWHNRIHAVQKSPIWARQISLSKVWRATFYASRRYAQVYGVMDVSWLFQAMQQPARSAACLKRVGISPEAQGCCRTWAEISRLTAYDPRQDQKTCRYKFGTLRRGKKIQPGGGLALLPATHHSLMLAGLICTNEVRARASYAVMISYSTPIWRLLNKNSGGCGGGSGISA